MGGQNERGHVHYLPKTDGKQRCAIKMKPIKVKPLHVDENPAVR